MHAQALLHVITCHCIAAYAGPAGSNHVCSVAWTLQQMHQRYNARHASLSLFLWLKVNVELLTIDKRTFTTDESNSLTTLFGESSEGSAQYRSEITTIATRLATVFASLKVIFDVFWTAPSTARTVSQVIQQYTLQCA